MDRYKSNKFILKTHNLHSVWCPTCRIWLGDYVEGVRVKCDKCKMEAEAKKIKTHRNENI